MQNTPRLTWGSVKLIAMGITKKTPSDIIKMRSGNYTLISEGGHSKWMMYIVYHIQNGTANIIEAEVCIDHVHMLVEIPPTIII